MPQSLVPGLGGVEFKPSTGTATLDRVYGSPNGNWIITATADVAAADDEVLIANGSLLQQEGQPGPWTGGLENCGPLDQKIGINDAGDFTFATNTDGAVNDDYIVTNVGGVWGYSAREGDAAGPVPGNTWDDTLDSPVILADGTSGFMADGLDGTLTATTDHFVILGGSVLLQQGVTIPPGQAAGGMETIGTMDFQDFWVTPDGANWLVQGDLDGSTTTDDVVIFNGAVVLQEGHPIPGSAFVEPIDLSGIVDIHLDAGGNWFARGNNDVSEQDWVVRNGVVIATLGDPITTGSTELWDDAAYGDCYFLHVGNSGGNYVIGGVTDNADPLLNGVLVLNGTTVVCREGDPIDVDGNGLFDDDVFVNAFGNDDAYLSDAGLLYVITTVKNAAGTTLGQVFMSIDTGAGSAGVTFCDPAANNSNGVPAVLSGSFGSGVGSDLHLELTGGVSGQLAYILVGNEATSGLAISDGLLCLVGTPTAQLFRYNVGGTDRNSIGGFNASGIMVNASGTSTTGFGFDVPSLIPSAVPTAIMSGDTWHFQGWYRDTPAGVGHSNFSNGLSVTF